MASPRKNSIDSLTAICCYLRRQYYIYLLAAVKDRLGDTYKGKKYFKNYISRSETLKSLYGLCINVN